MKKLLLVCFLFISVYPQTDVIRCTAAEYYKKMLIENPDMKIRREQMQERLSNFRIEETAPYKTVIIIPVVVHCIFYSSLDQVSYDQIKSQIRVLNEDFRRLNKDTVDTPNIFKSVADDIGIEFRLVDRDPQGKPHGGVNYVKTTKRYFNYETDDNYLKALQYWPSEKYLNIWICNLSNDILGYAQFPGGPAATDGVVIKNTAFGYGSRDATYNLGRTTTHEVGHWLDLYHIWGDDDGACGGSDMCNDTPDQDDMTYGCSHPFNCNGVSMYQNYMDYSDDKCMNIFTRDQKTRMHNAIKYYRNNLQLSYKNEYNVSSGSAGLNFQLKDLHNSSLAEFVLLQPKSASKLSIEINNVDDFLITGKETLPGYAKISIDDNTASGTLTIPYDSSKLKGMTEENLTLYRYNDYWVMLNGTVDKVKKTITITGANLNGLYVISDKNQNPLPVELTSFEASSNKYFVNLKWITSTETNSLGFQIERSENNEEYKVVGFVKSNGNSTEISNYSFIDKALPGEYSYRLKMIDLDGTFEYSNTIYQLVEKEITYELSSNYPNPFNPSTTIEYYIPEDGKVSLKVYDALGRETATLVNQFQTKGVYKSTFDASGLANGVYYYTIIVNDFSKTNKMTLLK